MAVELAVYEFIKHVKKNKNIPLSLSSIHP